MKTPTQAERLRAISASGRIPCVTEVANLRAAVDGAELADAERDDMLARAVRRERVQVILDVLAYEQVPGAPNRKGVRVREAAMKAFARSGRGAPFMRDHLQGDSLAKGGEIVDAKAFSDENGRSGVMLTVQLVEPSAVERALRGLMKSVSVGLNGGEVNCTACGAPVLTSCYHLPLDVTENKAGEKLTVEWEWQNPELIETSEVAIPAVPGARVRGEVRAALGWGDETTADSPQQQVDSAIGGGSLGSATPTQHTIKVPKMPDIKIPEDAAAAVQVLQAAEELERTKAELAIAQAEADRQLAELANHRAERNAAAQDKFILDAKRTGRITAVDEEAWRDLFVKNPDRAEELMSRRPAGCSAAVGIGAQSVVTQRRKASAALKVAGNRWVSERQRKAVLKSGMTDEQYHAALAKYDEMHPDGEELN